MNNEEALQILGKVGAIIIDSHIVYSSGRHGAIYINKDAIYPHTKDISKLCRAIAERFSDDGIETVIAPAIGGCVLSNRVAEHLTDITKHEVLSVYAEKELFLGESRFVIKRGYDKFVADKRILVVEDVLTTGSSVKKVIEAVRDIRGNVVGLGALVNRGDVTPKDVADVPKLVSLINIKLDSYEETNCPLCSQRIPINIRVGHGKEYLDGKNAVKKKFISG